jgi:hypothetical protein
MVLDAIAARPVKTSGRAGILDCRRIAEHRYNYNVILIRDLVNKKEEEVSVQLTRTGRCGH